MSWRRDALLLQKCYNPRPFRHLPRWEASPRDRAWQKRPFAFAKCRLQRSFKVAPTGNVRAPSCWMALAEMPSYSGGDQQCQGSLNLPIAGTAMCRSQKFAVIDGFSKMPDAVTATSCFHRSAIDNVYPYCRGGSWTPRPQLNAFTTSRRAARQRHKQTLHSNEQQCYRFLVYCMY